MRTIFQRLSKAKERMICLMVLQKEKPSKSFAENAAIEKDLMNDLSVAAIQCGLPQLLKIL